MDHKNIPLDIDEFQLRYATVADCYSVWLLANELSTRNNSFSSKQIPWEEHQKWFAQILENQNSVFLLLIIDGNICGQTRFVIDGFEASISISLAENARGKGLGAKVIRRSSDFLFQTTFVKKIHAYIKVDNIVSIRTFGKAGFTLYQQLIVKNHQAFDYILLKEENS